MSRPVDVALIAEMFDRNAATLEFYAAQWTTMPQDCVQEAFLQLARQASPPTDPGSWLFRVVRNRALNAARAESRRAAHEAHAARRQATSRHVADPGDAAAIADLLQLLADEQREIVVLRVWGQLSWQEIADIVNVSRSAAHRNYVQALNQLRNHLEPSSCPPTIRTNRT
jgi:RNA polymerase sigma-70 factor (ECF subfamily)